MLINGTIINILTQKENDWGRYRIDVIGKEIMAVGIIPSASVGMTVTLDGEEKNTAYGRQFQIKSVLKTESDKCAGVRRFLSDGYIKGIGPAKANILVQKFGNKVLDMFETEEGMTKLKTVKGFNERTIQNAKESYEENRKYKDIVLFLNGSGTKKQVSDILEKYGENAIKILKHNPYRLQKEIDGFGFLKTDLIALASGIKPSSLFRIMAGITHIVDEACFGMGHCYIPVDEIKSSVTQLLAPQPKCEEITELVAKNALSNWEENKQKLIKRYNPSYDTLERLSQTAETRKIIESNIDEAIQKGVEQGDFVLDGTNLYTKKMYDLENDVAKRIGEMLQKPPVRIVSERNIRYSIAQVEERKTKEMNANGKTGVFKATEEQTEAVYKSLSSPISIISGGPGRGKTAIIEMIAYSFLNSGRTYDKSDIIMLAPTGRASQRITESTGFTAMTCHRAVLSLKKEDAPKGKLVICDEFSMADIFLTDGVLKYAKDCALIFVGDVNQICSVGPGKCLRDMIDSGKIPCSMLTKGHRNTGTIASNSDLINAGLPISKYKYDGNFIYTPVTTENILNTVVSDYLKYIKIYGIKDVMLCTAMKKRGSASVEKLNNAIQQILTKGNEEAKFGDRVFRVGDRVIQMKNDYQFPIKRKGKIELGLFNGERGIVKKVFYSEEDEAYRLIVAFDDGSLAGYTKNSIESLELAYATTLHKCQGSEAECMMMAYTFADYKLLLRSLFYTGETRSQRCFHMYGEEKVKYGKMLSAFDLAVKNTEDAKRNTGLKQRIIQTMAS